MKRLEIYYRLISSCLEKYPNSLHDSDRNQLRARIYLLENITSNDILKRLLDFKTLISTRYQGSKPLYSLLRPILKESKTMEDLLLLFDEKCFSLYAHLLTLSRLG